MTFDIILAVTTGFSLALAVWCARKALECADGAREGWAAAAFWQRQASDYLEKLRRAGL